MSDVSEAKARVMEAEVEVIDAAMEFCEAEIGREIMGKAEDLLKAAKKLSLARKDLVAVEAYESIMRRS